MNETDRGDEQDRPAELSPPVIPASEPPPLPGSANQPQASPPGARRRRFAVRGALGAGLVFGLMILLAAWRYLSRERHEPAEPAAFAPAENRSV